MTLIEELQEEIIRVKEIIKDYELYPGGQFVSIEMALTVRTAEKAIARENNIMMKRCLKELKLY